MHILFIYIYISYNSWVNNTIYIYIFNSWANNTMRHNEEAKDLATSDNYYQMKMQNFL